MISAITCFGQKADTNFATSIIREAAGDYLLSDSLSKQLSHYTNSKVPGTTLVFTIDSEFHEHMFSVDLEAKDDVLALKIYDAKSNEVRKDIKFDKDILTIEKAPLRELFHRMLQKPGTKVSFKMMEDLIKELIPMFPLLTHTLTIDTITQKVKLSFISNESTVAVFDMYIEEVLISRELEKFDYVLHVDPQVSIGNKKIFNTPYKFSMFDSKVSFDILDALRKIPTVPLFSNDLLDAAKLFIKTMQAVGFKDLAEKFTMINGVKTPQIIMKFNKSYVITNIHYVPNADGVGQYSMEVFKALGSSLDNLVPYEKPEAVLDFTRMLQTDLRMKFEELDLKKLQTTYHDEILNKFQEEYNKVILPRFTDYPLIRSPVEQTLKKQMFSFNSTPDRKIKASIAALNRAKISFCEFDYLEDAGKIALNMRLKNHDIIFNLGFDVDKYDFAIIEVYIEKVIANANMLIPTMAQ